MVGGIKSHPLIPSAVTTAAALPEEQRLRHPKDPLRPPLARQIRHPVAQQEGNDLGQRPKEPAAPERPQAALLFLFAKEAERVRNTQRASAATSATAKTFHARKVEDEAAFGAATPATAAAAATTSDAPAAGRHALLSRDQVPVQGKGNNPISSLQLRSFIRLSSRGQGLGKRTSSSSGFSSARSVGSESSVSISSDSNFPSPSALRRINENSTFNSPHSPQSSPQKQQGGAQSINIVKL